MQRSLVTRRTTSQASIRPCWSTWNVLCRSRTSGLIAANPMPLAGRTKVLKTLPKTLPRAEVSAVVEAIMSAVTARPITARTVR